MKIPVKTRVLLVNGEGTHQDDVSTHLNDANRFELTKISPDMLPGELSEDSADLVIVDISKLEDEEIQVLSGVRGQAPSVPIIVMSNELDSDAMRKLFKFGVKDWLNKPTDADELLASIRSSVQLSKASQHRVHAIVSAVGGAGATTTAIAMTDLAANKILRKKASVALFDLDFSSGNCSFALNMINEFNLATVVATPRRIDTEFIRVIQQEHDKGFYLYSFKRPELNTELNGYELVLRLLDAVNLEHDHTFLDIPYYETDWKDDVLQAVNTCTLVTELNLPALKHALDFVSRIKSLRGDDFPVQVLINKHKSRFFNRRISRRKLKDLFGDTPFRYLPLEDSVIGEAADRGMLPSEVSKRNAFYKSVLKYMKTIEVKGEVST